MYANLQRCNYVHVIQSFDSRCAAVVFRSNCRLFDLVALQSI